MARVAGGVASRLRPEAKDLLLAAGWLHDVGYSRDVASTGCHQLDGARYVRRLGGSAVLCGLIAWHSEAGEEASRRGLRAQLDEFSRPPEDLLALITYADMTTGPTGEPVTVDQRLDEILRRYPVDDPVYLAISAAQGALRTAVRCVQLRLDAVNRGTAAAAG